MSKILLCSALFGWVLGIVPALIVYAFKRVNDATFA